jgi:hypothetical protein
MFLCYRIAKQQETARQSSKEKKDMKIPYSVVKPPTVAPAPNYNFLQSNLDQLSQKKPVTQPPITPNYNLSSMNQSAPNYNISLGSNQNGPYGYNQNMPTGFNSQLALPPNTAWSSNPGNFNNKWANNQNNQSNMKQDWSAFESLLPNQNQNNNQNSNDNVKKLTSGEMMDLLS